MSARGSSSARRRHTPAGAMGADQSTAAGKAPAGKQEKVSGDTARGDAHDIEARAAGPRGGSRGGAAGLTVAWRDVPSAALRVCRRHFPCTPSPTLPRTVRRMTAGW